VPSWVNGHCEPLAQGREWQGAIAQRERSIQRSKKSTAVLDHLVSVYVPPLAGRDIGNARVAEVHRLLLAAAQINFTKKPADTPGSRVTH
jgi:hypothetical protein